MWKVIAGFVVVLCTLRATTYVSALDNGIALTPPMGWMSWERFRCITDCDGNSN